VSFVRVESSHQTFLHGCRDSWGAFRSLANCDGFRHNIANALLCWSSDGRALILLLSCERRGNALVFWLWGFSDGGGRGRLLLLLLRGALGGLGQTTSQAAENATTLLLLGSLLGGRNILLVLSWDTNRVGLGTDHRSYNDRLDWGRSGWSYWVLNFRWYRIDLGGL